MQAAADHSLVTSIDTNYGSCKQCCCCCWHMRTHMLGFCPSFLPHTCLQDMSVLSCPSGVLQVTRVPSWLVPTKTQCQHVQGHEERATTDACRRSQ